MTTTDAPAALRAALTAMPLIAILRGITPPEAFDVGTALVDAGFRIIEVPLNSPSAFDSIERMKRGLGTRALIGAGTVTTPDEVRRLADVGGDIAVSPHTDPAVIEATCAHGMISAPGVLSPTEAFAALKAGAHALKLFPLEIIGPRGIGALRAVLPDNVTLIGVGGVTSATLPSLRAAGCHAFGTGSSLYRSGMTSSEVRTRATEFVAAARALV